MPSHHRLASLSCLSSEKPRNGPATQSSGPTSFSGKRQFPLPASSPQIAPLSAHTVTRTTINSAVPPAAVEAESNNKVANEVIEIPQDADTRRQRLITNRNLKPAQAIQQPEAANATENVLSTDIRVLAPSGKPDRPVFSALQQDFGAKQAPRELHSYLPHSPNGVIIDRLSPEALASNLELLQLHMLHRSSVVTKLQWESSAKKHYRSRFDELASDHENMTARETNFQEQVNATAIIAWGTRTDNVSIGIKIQKLSRILNDVTEFSDPSGQYTCLVNSFEHWYSNAFRIRQLRASRDSIHPHIGRTLEGIGDGWKAEVDTLRSKLLAYQEELISLGDAHPKSDLIRCLDAALGGLTNMLAELDMIQAIETQFLRDEEDWLNESLGRIVADLSSGMSVPVNRERRR